MTEPPAYTDAWIYWQFGWPPDTELKWYPTADGDRLELGLPDSLVGVRVDSEADLEALAWSETRLGKLPRTFASNYSDAYGTRLYRVSRGFAWKGYTDYPTTMLRRRSFVTVAPSVHPSKYGQILWRGPSGDWTAHPPFFDDITPFPKTWELEFRGDPRPPDDMPVAYRGSELAPVDAVTKFLESTVVYTGRRTDRLTTDQLYGMFGQWRMRVQTEPVSKIHFARLLAKAGWLSWSGQTADGYRRGYLGVRFPGGL